MPLGPRPNEVRFYDLYYAPYGGSTKSSCKDIPGKLVIYTWFDNLNCEGPSDMTQDFTPDFESCESFTYFVPSNGDRQERFALGGCAAADWSGATPAFPLVERSFHVWIIAPSRGCKKLFS